MHRNIVQAFSGTELVELVNVHSTCVTVFLWVWQHVLEKKIEISHEASLCLCKSIIIYDCVIANKIKHLATFTLCMHSFNGKQVSLWVI